MSIDVNWTTGLITCSQSELTLLSGTKYQLTVDRLWELLRDRSDNEDAIPYPILYTNTPPTASTPRIVEINSDYYTFQFENGLYSVDIVNGNTNIRDVEVKNSVSIGTNNTTGFVDPRFLELSAFDGGVAIHITNGYELTPTGKTANNGIIGTRQTAVNNIEDAIEIANIRGLKKIYLMSNITIQSPTSVNGYVFIGDSQVSTVVTIEANADVTNCEFRNLYILGTLDNGNILRNCIVDDLDYFNGLIDQCGISGTITLGGSSQAMIWNCYAYVSGGYPIIDIGGSNNSLAIRDWCGGLGLQNYSGGGNVSIDMSSGKLFLDSTLTGGTIYIRGVTQIEDLSNGSIINTDGIVASSAEANPWSRSLDDNEAADTFGDLMQRMLTVSKFLGLK